MTMCTSPVTCYLEPILVSSFDLEFVRPIVVCQKGLEKIPSSELYQPLSLLRPETKEVLSSTKTLLEDVVKKTSRRGFTIEVYSSLLRMEEMGLLDADILRNIRDFVDNLYFQTVTLFYFSSYRFTKKSLEELLEIS